MFRVNVKNVARWLQHRLSTAPFTDRIVNHFLVQTVTFLLDTLAQLFHVRDLVDGGACTHALVGSPTLRNRRGSDPDCLAATAAE